MIRTYKRKLILTKAQSERIEQWMGVCRMVYNMGLEIRISAWKNRQENIHKYELMKQITEIRKEYDLVKDVCAQSLQDCIDRLEKSYSYFFKGCGFPKFKSKRKNNSVGFKSIKVEHNKIILEKFGVVKMLKDTPILGTPKTAIVIKEPTGYFVCIQCKEVPKKFISENQAVGLDMGLSSFCIDSNGNFISNPKHFEKYERRLRIENRSLARKKKGSNSWKKQCKRLSLLHHKIANVRKDFLHKQSTIIAKGYSSVCMEGLNIAGMVKNKNLSKHILDVGWGMFKTMLDYKTNVIKVNPKYTSQTCSACNHVDSNSRLNQSNFTCTNCGYSENADVNAAKNILRKGIALGRERGSLDCALTLKFK